MKTKLHSSFIILHSAFFILSLALLTTASHAPAQNTVTVSAAEFQRLVYSAHLHTQLALKPELEASLQTLLEMQRRNPNATPAALADLSRQALQLYRTNAPTYIRTNGFRDEILAAYLDAVRQVPAHTNFIPVNLTLLKNFMLGAADYNYFTNDTVLDLINSADQRLSSTEGEAIQRQALVDNCVARAQANAAFATALDSLLSPETLVSLGDIPAEIIGNTNSPLHNDLTMTNLLALSEASGDGSLTVSTNQLMNLFTDEMQTMWDTIHTNLATLAQINQSQPDLLAYLTNQAAIDANVQLVAAVQQGQPARLACATAAVLVQSQLLPVNSPEDNTRRDQILDAVGGVAEAAVGVSKLSTGDPEGLTGLLSSGLDFIKTFDEGKPTVETQIATQLSNVQTMLSDLSLNMNYRFDRVDQSLTTIFDTMNQQFSKIEITLDGQIARLNGSVDDIRSSLVDVQSSLDRIEAENFASFSAAQQDQIVGPIDNDLLYTVQYPPTRGPFPEVGSGSSGGGYEADEGLFYKYAMNDANDTISSPSSSLDLSASDLQQQLTAYRPLDANLNYIQQFLTSTLNVNTVGTPGNPFSLSNPQEWFISAYAYLQLAGENPMYFRKDASQRRVSDIISRGQNVANFCGSLTFTGANINWPLYTALENYYLTNLISFNTQVSTLEGTYATNNNFALGTWRYWDAAAPRVTVAATELRYSPAIPSITVPRGAATSIAAGQWHNLALMTDGTVVGWGANASGQTTIPTGLTNCLAIAAGGSHSLALKIDGTVVAWGDNIWGQTNVPAGLTNVAAIAAGADHSLALKADGTVVGWGDNSYGQINIPTGLTNVVAIAAGAAHSLALKTDGTVVGWGAGGPTASGYALSFDGVDDKVTVANQGVLNAYPLTISAWIKTSQVDSTSRGIVNKYGSGSFNGYQLFLVSGDIHAWYFRGANQYVWGGGNGMDGGFVADGQWHHVAFVVDASGGRLFVDGTLKASMLWTGAPGATTTSQPVSLGYYPQSQPTNGFYSGLLDEVRIWNVARSQTDIQGDMLHGLTGAEPGLLAYWKLDEGSGVTTTNSAVATGSACNGQLAGPAWVTGWGQFGQATAPAGLSNVVAIAAGAYDSLALKADGTLVAWGDDTCGQTNVPLNGKDVVAIAGGGYHSCALKVDGTVVVWGDNSQRQGLVPRALTWRGAIAAGGGHGLALKADGTVVGWGANASGQTTIPTGLTNCLAIAAGGSHSLALKIDGTVVAWGDNIWGQTNVPAGLTNVAAIAAGADHSLALKADGTVVGWGDNVQGQISIPAGLSSVVAIAAGDWHSLALKADGTVVAWGDNYYGQTNLAPGLTNVVAIAAGERHSLALRADGTVVGWGYNNCGQINLPSGLTNVVAVAAGSDDSLAIEADGTVVGWGDNSHDQINIPTGLTNVVAIAACGYNNFALKADGTAVFWGYNGCGQNVPPVALTTVVAIAAGDHHDLALRADGTVVDWGMGYSSPGLTNVGAIAAGDTHSLALKSDGTVVGWGYNYYGETVVPAGLSNVVAVAAGFEYSLALKSDGTVVGWGYNGNGQTDIPFSVNDVVAIAVGATASLALKSDGTVVGWGYNGQGEISIPAGLGNVVAIAAGAHHSLALKADGTVVGWGDNTYGQTNVPTGLNNVVAIAAGAYHGLALKADGTVVGWGDNTYGQINIPSGLSNVLAVAASSDRSLFLTAAGISGTVTNQGVSLVRAQIPARVPTLFQSCNQNTINELGLTGSALDTAAAQLTGAKMLLADVLELGMPYTLAQDDVLHGFLYGSESLTDTGIATNFLQIQNVQLQNSPNTPALALVEWDWLSYLRFQDRLNQCLTNLQATGQPEIPRLVGHTLRLLNLLSDAYSPAPPPALEMSSVSNSPSLLLYGEPYARYTLQYRDTLRVPGWTTTTITNLQDAQTITPPLSNGPQRFYRAMLPVP